MSIDLFADEDTYKEATEFHSTALNEVKEHINGAWPKKWEPKRIADVILPDKIKNTVQYALQENQFNHMLFHSGKPGTGKSTVAKAIPEEFGCDYRFLKISKQSMDIIGVIESFAMQKISDGKPRFVIIDEADRPSPTIRDNFYTALQPLIDQSTPTLRFILTANNLHLIPEPVRSRCTPISFAHRDDATVKKALFKRMIEIAETETSAVDGTFDKETLKEIARFYYPDIRALIGAMQQCFLENRGSIIGTPTFSAVDLIPKMWDMVQTFNDDALRLYASEHVVDYSTMFSMFGKYAMPRLDKKHRLDFSILLAEYQYRSAQSAVDQEINFDAFMAHLMKVLKNG